MSGKSTFMREKYSLQDVRNVWPFVQSLSNSFGVLDFILVVSNTFKGGFTGGTGSGAVGGGYLCC